MQSNAVNVTKLGALADGKSSYERWAEEQGVPIVKTFFLPNLNEVVLGAWERKGGKGAIINLEGTGDTDDAYICEIAPGRKSLLRSATSMRNSSTFLKAVARRRYGRKAASSRPLSGRAGSLFVIPLNAWFQHFNGSGDQSARYIAFTSAPLMMNLLNDQEFIFNCPYIFRNRFDGESDYFKGEGSYYGSRIWDINFIANIHELKLKGQRRARPWQSHYYYRDRLQRADRAHVAVLRRTIQKSASTCRRRSNHYSGRLRLFSVMAGGLRAQTLRLAAQ